MDKTFLYYETGEDSSSLIDVGRISMISGGPKGSKIYCDNFDIIFDSSESIKSLIDKMTGIYNAN